MDEQRYYDVMSSRQEESTARHLANGGSMASLAGADTGHVLLTIGEAGRHRQNS